MYRLIIADDEVIEIEYLKKLFLKHQDEFQIIGTATNGEELIHIFEKNKVDAIILDICMPGKSGLAVAEYFKKREPNVSIILNTAFAEFEFARKAIEYHLDAYLLKPASEETIMETLRKCLKKKNDSGNYVSENRPLYSIARYIDSHYQEELTLKELAKIANFSPSYFSKMFHQEFGCTLSHYIHKKRIENAKLLLVQTEWRIQEIAKSCGFINVSHFNRVFKNLVGKSPVDYKRENGY